MASKQGEADRAFTGLFALPSDLEELVISRFDQAVATGQLIYEPSTAETVEDKGFHLSYRHVPHLRWKPITPADAVERKTGTGNDPFLHPPPSEVVSAVGPFHTLLVNKFSVYRPSLVLITRDFASQNDCLNGSDLAAAWSLLRHLQRPYMMIYNCGVESGSSQGHKHMQLWPYPDEERLGFQLFPSNAQSDTHIASDIAHVPHKHYVLRLPMDAQVHTLTQAYDTLFSAARQDASGCADHNVILVKDWICIIPRQHSGLDRGAGANSAAMLGLVWTVTEKERQVWAADGPAEYFKYLGVPK